MAYDVLVVLHAVCAVVGFGAVALSGAYGAISRRDPAGDEGRRYFGSPNRAEYLILAVPVPGAAALAVKGSGWGDGWVLAGLAIWLVASGLLVGVVRPAGAALRVGPDIRAASRVMWAGVASDLLFVVALFAMVTQPG